MKLFQRTPYSHEQPLAAVAWSSRCCPKGFLRRKGLKVSTNISSSKIFVFFNIQSLINNCSFRQQNLRESKTKCWHETDRQTREVFRGEMSRDGVFNKATDPDQPAFSLSAAIASVICLSLAHTWRRHSSLSLVHDTYAFGCSYMLTTDQPYLADLSSKIRLTDWMTDSPTHSLTLSLIHSLTHLFLRSVKTTRSDYSWFVLIIIPTV